MASSKLKLKLKTVATTLALVPMVSVFNVAHAETAVQAMAYAYKHSNVIALEREKIKLTNESLLSAKAGLLPTLNGQLESSYSKTRNNINDNVSTQDVFGARATLSAGMNIWDNGITKNRIQQAQIGQSVQRDLFANAEQGFLLNVFTAYVDVLRDIALLNVQIKEFNVLSEQERAAKARFEVGEATATDVSLALAKKTGAASSIAGSKAQLDASRAVYEQHVGHKPRNLSQPSQVSRLLPASERSAIAYAEAHHPALKSAKKAVLVAQKDVEIAEAGLKPSASAFGSASHQLAYDGDSSSTNLTLGARVDIPIFNGGVKQSQVRQAKIKVAQARHDLSIARAQVKAGVKMRWAALKASKQTLVANNAQIKASQAVLNGVRAEADEGVRTSFDVLNSEQQLLSARVQAIVSQRGLLLSEMQLLSSIGKLSLKNLGIR